MRSRCRPLPHRATVRRSRSVAAPFTSMRRAGAPGARSTQRPSALSTKRGWARTHRRPAGPEMSKNFAPKQVDVANLRQWLGGTGEVAFLDVREEGQHGAGHPLLAVNAPYSRLELIIGQVAPRRGCPVVLLDGGDGVTEKAARRLAALGYSAVHVVAGGVGAWSAAGYPLFPSTNVPSKAFAEIVEH